MREYAKSGTAKESRMTDAQTKGLLQVVRRALLMIVREIEKVLDNAGGQRMIGRKEENERTDGAG